MFTSVKLTRSGIPVPRDSTGREMCLLFIKYGRCRFKNKCKKSHWTPPLPDEEYPKPPPLPPSPPSSFTVSNTPIDAQVINQGNFLVPEQRHTLLAVETTYNQNRCAPQLEKENDSVTWIQRDCGWSNSQGLSYSNPTSNKGQHELVTLAQNTGKGQLLVHLPLQGDLQNGNDPRFTINNLTMTPTCTSFINKKNDLGANLEKEIQGLENPGGETRVDSNVVLQTKETTMDRISQVIFKARCRFDFVYHPNRQGKGDSCKLKSSIDQSYQHYGAYYNNVKKKLEFHHQPRNKVEKKNLKLLRRAHWHTCQNLKARLAQLPPGYSLKVDFTRVNFNRLRPYFCLLVHQVRQCISHMWEIIVKSSLSAGGVAQEVLSCERQVFAKKLPAVDYAYACSIAGPLMKGSVSDVGNNSLPGITRSVRQGIQAAKQAKRASIKAPGFVGTVRVRTKCRTIQAGAKTLSSGGVRKTKGVNFKRKKRKTKRAMQLSLLDEQGKQDLQKRCKTIRAEAEEDVQAWS